MRTGGGEMSRGGRVPLSVVVVVDVVVVVVVVVVELAAKAACKEY